MTTIALADDSQPLLLNETSRTDRKAIESVLLAREEAAAKAAKKRQGSTPLTPAQESAKKQVEHARSQRRNKALLSLLWRSLLIALFVGLLAALVSWITTMIAGGRTSWRSILAAAVGSAFLTFALSFSIVAVQIFQQP